MSRIVQGTAPLPRYSPVRSLLLPLTLVSALALALGCAAGGHDEPAPPNIVLPTLGGKQLWSDVAWRDGWRIQENALTGHHRLLDPRDLRRKWGSYAACREALDGAVEPEGRSHLVVLLHGLGRSRSSMRRLGRALEREGYSVARVSYASTRRSIEEHADRLTRLLDGLEGVESVSFVTHSLGGMVVREALGREPAASDWRARMEVRGLCMIGPPSTGSTLALRLGVLPPVRWLLGPSLDDLTPSGAADVPAPPCRAAIIAGGSPSARGYDPLVPGDDDGVVGVDEARLEGVDDFLRVRGLHTFLMDRPAVVEAVARFLAGGRVDSGG